MKRGATILILLMLTSSLVAFLPNIHQDDEPLHVKLAMGSASLNSTEIVSINNYPTTVSNSFKLDIPENQAVRNISLELAPLELPRSDGYSFTQPTDFNQSGATSQGVDYNSSGLQVSPDLHAQFSKHIFHARLSYPRCHTRPVNCFSRSCFHTP